MPKWEYKVAAIQGTQFLGNEIFLNNCGGYGWELVAVVSGIAYFKRLRGQNVTPAEAAAEGAK